MLQSERFKVLWCDSTTVVCYLNKLRAMLLQSHLLCVCVCVCVLSVHVGGWVCMGVCMEGGGV